MTTTRELIRTSLKARGLTMKDASLALGRNPAYLQQYLERGSPKHLQEEEREALAPLLGLRPEELRENMVRKKAPGAATGDRFRVRSDATAHRTREPINDRMLRDLPVLGGASCGDDGLFEFNGQTLDHVRRPHRLLGVPGSYAVYIDGNSMAPWREHGGVVVVHPHMPVKPGDYVVVQLHPTSDGAPAAAYIKRLVRRTANEVRLRQYNPDKEFTISFRKIMAIHRILDMSELLSL